MAKRKRKSGELMRQRAVHPLGRLTLAGLHIDIHEPTPTPMRFWDTFALVYVLAGRARFHDETGLDLPMRPGDLLVMFPGHGYHYDVNPKPLWSELFLQFQGPIFDLWREHKVLDPAHPIYRLTPIESWLQRLEDLVRRPAYHGAGHVLKQVCRLQEFLADMLAEGRGRKSERPKDLWLADASALLDKHSVATPVNWQDMAGQMGLSYDRFRKKFLQCTGVSPARYLMARRLELACQLLQNRQMGLKEIARACGFCDVFHFSKRFKQLLRLTPTEYREFKLPGTAVDPGHS